jgi:hypothetical protein
MKDALRSKIGVFADIAIIVVAMIGGAALIKQHWWDASQRQKPPTQASEYPAAGSKITLPGVDWSLSKHNLLIALSTNCHFCSESAPFYQRIIGEAGMRNGFSSIAAFPQDAKQSADFLDKYGIRVNRVVQCSPESIGIRGTPTLVIVDNHGIVKKAWIGRLSVQQEADVMKWLSDNKHRA